MMNHISLNSVRKIFQSIPLYNNRMKQNKQMYDSSAVFQVFDKYSFFHIRFRFFIFVLFVFYCMIFLLLPFNFPVFSDEPKIQSDNPITVPSSSSQSVLPMPIGQPITTDDNGDIVLSDGVISSVPAETISEDLNCFEVIPSGTIVCIPKFTRHESPWARFLPGTWCRTRTIGVSYENGKVLKSITETKLTLHQVDDDSYYLLREVTIKMGLMDHNKKPEMLRYDFWGVPIDENMVVENLPAVGLQITRKVIPCQVRRITRMTPQWKEVITLYYSTVIAPYLIQRQENRIALGTENNAAINNGKGATISASSMNVQKTSAHLFLGKDLNSYWSQTLTYKGSYVTTANTLHSELIPGGIVRENTAETDINGNKIYYSNTNLLDYYIAH